MLCSSKTDVTSYKTDYQHSFTVSDKCLIIKQKIIIGQQKQPTDYHDIIETQAVIRHGKNRDQ